MIRREFGIFLIVGCSATLVDFGIYHGLLWAGWLGTYGAKATGFMIGTVFAYFANRLWTFSHVRHKAGSAPRFFCLYALTMGANVLVNGLALGWLGGVPAAIHIAFVLATGVSTVLNFAGMKLFVFRASAQAEGS